MNIQIDNNVKLPRGRRTAAEKSAEAAFEAYADAYHGVYGVRPLSFRYDKASKFVYIGNSAGVSVARLRELTTQLRYRKG